MMLFCRISIIFLTLVSGHANHKCEVYVALEGCLRRRMMAGFLVSQPHPCTLIIQDVAWILDLSYRMFLDS